MYYRNLYVKSSCSKRSLFWSWVVFIYRVFVLLHHSSSSKAAIPLIAQMGCTFTPCYLSFSPLQRCEDWQVDYQSYKWTKLDPDTAETKEMVKKFFMWEGDFGPLKVNQGKTYKWTVTSPAAFHIPNHFCQFVSIHSLAQQYQSPLTYPPTLGNGPDMPFQIVRMQYVGKHERIVIN